MGDSIEGDAWTAAYWDDILHEFGTQAYYELRYESGLTNTKETVMSNEFTANITGVKVVEVSTGDITDAIESASEYEVQQALGALDDYEVTEVEADTDTIEVRVSFAGQLSVQLDEDDIVQLVKRQVEDELGSDFEDLDIEVE